MPEPEIKINLKLDAAEAQKALEDVKRKAESLQSVNTSTGGASVSVSAEATAKDTAAWRENTEAKKAATETHDALNVAVGKVSEQVAVNTATTAQNTAAWRENAEARTLAMADTEGAAERIERMAEAQAKLAAASAQAAGAWTQAKKPVSDYTASLELQTKTYEELLQLYEELMERRAAAQTAEEVKEIDIQLNSVRKNMRMMGQDARMSGAQVIGSQTSIQGVFRATISQWRKGTLTLKALTQGMKMFAKSTVFLAAIQLAWELLTNVWEKAKEALFGTAEAAEAAAEKQKKLADAAKEASTNLINAQTALAAAREDEARQKAAQDLVNTIKAQNDYYKEQINLVNEATAAQLRQAAITAKEDEQAIAMERLELQEKLMLGLIDEYEYKEKLIDLDLKQKEKQGLFALEKKEIAQADAEKKLQQAKQKLADTNKIELKDESEYGLTTAQVKTKVENYKTWMADAEEIKGKMAELEEERSEMEFRLRAYEILGGGNSHNWLVRNATKTVKSKLEANRLTQKSLQIDFKKLEDGALNAYAEIPELVIQAGMSDDSISRYGKKREDVLTFNKNIRKKREDVQKEVAKAQEAADKAELEYNNATKDELQAAENRQEIADKQKELNKFKKENAKKNEANENKIQAARDKVNSMEYAEIKAEEKRLLAEAAKVGDRTPEGKRLAALAGVYTTERRSRDAAARKAKEDMQFFARGTSGKTAANIGAMGELAEDMVQYGSANLDKARELAKKVRETKNKADDKAFLEMFKLLETLMTEEQQNSKKAKILEREVKRIQNKMTKS